MYQSFLNCLRRKKSKLIFKYRHLLKISEENWMRTMKLFFSRRLHCKIGFFPFSLGRSKQNQIYAWMGMFLFSKHVLIVFILWVLVMWFDKLLIAFLIMRIHHYTNFMEISCISKWMNTGLWKRKIIPM